MICYKIMLLFIYMCHMFMFCTAGKIPDFIKKPTNVSAPLKGEAKFEIEIDGEPEPEVKWLV